MGCAASTSTRISTSLSSDTIGASTDTSRSKPCSGSPHTITRRVTEISSGATIPAKACRRSGASRGAEGQRPACGQTDQDLLNNPDMTKTPPAGPINYKYSSGYRDLQGRGLTRLLPDAVRVALFVGAGVLDCQLVVVL